MDDVADVGIRQVLTDSIDHVVPAVEVEPPTGWLRVEDRVQPDRVFGEPLDAHQMVVALDAPNVTHPAGLGSYRCRDVKVSFTPGDQFSGVVERCRVSFTTTDPLVALGLVALAGLAVGYAREISSAADDVAVPGSWLEPSSRQNRCSPHLDGSISSLADAAPRSAGTSVYRKAQNDDSSWGAGQRWSDRSVTAVGIRR